MLEEVDYSEAKLLLKRLWPKSFEFIDNIHAQIAFTGEECRQHLKPQYFVWRQNGEMIATTHCYRTGFGRVRIRGTFVDEKFRNQNIGQKLVLSALELYGDCHEAFTFPRTGTELFYRNMGFKLKAAATPSRDSIKGYAYAEKLLIPRLHF